ncbi:Ger(x)C family spore germination protein [Peribacillus sp. SCS-26]|uniref:Ger(x)C family spore germination protein n=1 Tax=Paraperibacillus marinus TaxID=3115295 RepID=UPI00390629E5
MRKIRICLLLIPILLGGCWDQRLIKESTLIRIKGFDAKGEEIIQSVGYPIIPFGHPPSDAPRSLVAWTKSSSHADARENLDRKLLQRYDTSKVKVFLFGEDLARKDIYNALDIIYRDPKGPLNSIVAVVKGSALDALQIKPRSTPLLDDYYEELIESGKDSGTFRLENVQSICTAIFRMGKDYVLPYIDLKKGEHRGNIRGTALFHHKKMTGTLNYEESAMLTLLNDMYKSGRPKFFLDTGLKGPAGAGILSAESKSVSRDIKINPRPGGKLTVNLTYKVELEIEQFAPDHLTDKKKVQELQKKMSTKLNALSKKTLAKLQKANCDALGIGERVRAFHPEAWKNMDWEKDYRSIKIKPVVKAEFIQHGIIN